MTSRQAGKALKSSLFLEPRKGVRWQDDCSKAPFLPLGYGPATKPPQGTHLHGAKGST
jgi:hypothetical protein